MNRWIAIMATTIIVVLIGAVLYQFQQNVALSEGFPHTVSEIKGVARENFLGKKVAVEGYLASAGNDTFFLVQDFDLFRVNMPMPESRYLPVKGLAFDEAQDFLGVLVRIKGTVTDDEGQLTLKKDPLADIIVVDLNWLIKQAWMRHALIVNLTKFQHFVRISDNYAVLISGGIDTKNAHKRYWNDLKTMYHILVYDYGYQPNRIIVIYKDGVGEDNSVPVNYSATVANVQTVFQDLANKITNQELLFVFTTNHGGGFNPNDPYGQYMYGLDDNNGDEPETGYSEGVYGIDFNDDGDTDDVLPAADEVLNLYFNEALRDDDLATLLNNINANRTIIFMEQCFSGGFIHDLNGNNRIVLTACSEEEFSWGADTEGTYDEFVFHFMDAVGLANGVINSNADSNVDFRVSMVEAFNFAKQNDNQNEAPLYDDSSNIGATTFLDS